MTNTLTFTDLLAVAVASSEAHPKRFSLPVAFHPHEPCHPPHLEADRARVLQAAIEILQQGEDLLNSLTPEVFARRVPIVFNACIGGHYRHCLDHFTSLLSSTGTELVDYGHRERDPRIETQPDFALFVTRDLRARLNALTTSALGAAVTTRCEVSYTHGDSPGTRSTFVRELAYCIAHAIHHYALISVMARVMEVKLPENFGVAPSTVAHLAKLNGH